MNTVSPQKGELEITNGKAHPLVSVIIPAFNEENEIEMVINEMLKQTYAKTEIIIVDDGSTDQTYAKASAMLSGHEATKIVRGTHGGPSYARNLGVRESKGDIVFFGECDCIYDPDYIEKAVKALGDNKLAGAVCLTGAPFKLKSTLATDCIELENIQQHNLLKTGRIKPFYAWVFSKSIFITVGGFDEKLFQAEDRDLFNRVVKAGYQIAWVPGIHWRHKRAETLSELGKKWFLRGRTRVLYSVKNRLYLDLAKALLPFWVLVLGILTLFFFPVFGLALVLFVLILFLIQTSRVMRVTWSSVKPKRVFLEYPMFLATRNFSTALGYTSGIVMIFIRKAQKREITYRNI